MSTIKIRSSSLVELGSIPSAYSASRHEKINSDNTLTFSMPLSSVNTGLVRKSHIAEVDNDYFDIVYFHKGQSSGGELSASVECEHISYRLNNPDYDLEFFTETGAPIEILKKMLHGTGFTAGTVEYAAAATYSITEKKSRRQMLMEFVDLLGGEASFNKFSISILQYRGSTVPKDLTIGRNIDVISYTLNSREKDINGNPLEAYGCSLINPMEINLGDLVTLDYGTLDIDVVLRVVSINKDPYNSYSVDFEIGNFTPGLSDDAYRIETCMVGKGRSYYGARIGPENGFESIRSDKLARGVFNADLFALQTGDGTGDNWTNALYFDAVNKKYVFDGELSATVINAIKANIDVVVTNTIITQNLYAQMGNVANLTVNHLLTDDILAGKDNSYYIDIQDQYIRFMKAAKRADLPMIQYEDDEGNQLYWKNSEKKEMVTEKTAYPVMVFQYDRGERLKLYFDENTSSFYPKMVWGSGSGNGDRQKGFIYKDENGLTLEYVKSDNSKVSIKLGENGVTITPYELQRLAFNSDGFSATYNGETYNWTWTKDGTGKITLLSIDGRTIPVTWA